MTFQRERATNIEKILISGAQVGVGEIEPVLREEIGLQLEVIEQARGIQISKRMPADLDETSYIELIGLCMKHEEMKINLLPQSMAEDKEFMFLKKSLTEIGIFCIAILLVLGGSVVKKIIDKAHYLGLLNSKIEAMEPQVTKAKRMREDIKIIKSVVQKKPLAIDVLSEIYGITPAGINFNLMDYESGKSLVVRGHGPSLDSVITYMKTLEDSRLFESVKVKYTAKRATRDSELTDFEMVCILTST